MRSAHPHDPEIGRRWCVLAIQVGQYQRARRCAAEFYAGQTASIERAKWARLEGTAAFRGLELEDALSTFQLSLGHLCDMGDSGQWPRPKPPETKVQTSAFVDGVAEQLFWSTSVALARAGFAAFAFAGTLLGLEREGHLLAFDKDIDLGIWTEDFNACCEWLQQQGWKKISGGLPYRDFCALMHPASQVTLDLVGLQRLPSERRVVGGFLLDGYGPEYQSVRAFPWFDLELRATPAGDVWSIQQADVVLSALYGAWRTPNPWWDGMVSDLCMTELTLLWRCYSYDRLLLRWMSGEPERAWAYAHQILLKDAADAGVVRAKQCLGRLLAKVNPGALTWPPHARLAMPVAS